MATTMTMYYLTKRILRTMGLIILTMAQLAIVGMIIQVMMMVLTHTLGLHQMAMTNTQDTMTQQKRKTQQTTKEWE